MKLRNKQTGEIYEIPLIQIPNLPFGGNFSSLSSLNEEWEDAPEEITLCENCWCMTHTRDGKCAKCGEVKNVSRYTGLFTFDIDTHKYIPIAQAKEILNLQKDEDGRD